MALKKSELYSSLWSGCDELRGGMDASQYKDYVLVLLFVKYVSDKYAGKAYAALTEDDIKTIVVDDKWLATLGAAVQGELDRVSQTLTGRIRQLADRYATPLPKLTTEVETLAAQVAVHLKKMGVGSY